MSTRNCARCGKPAQAADALFCAYCGARLAEDTPTQAEAREMLREADKLSDPARKRQQLMRAREAYPNSLEVAEAILYFGRLHERNPRTMDFSVIKCYLWNIYLAPEELSERQREDMRRELFTHPDLQRCQALAPDADAFTQHYLERLAREFIRLFLRGSNRYMHAVFGLRVDGRASRTLAAPVSHMLARIQVDAALTSQQREMLYTALYRAFSADMDGDTQYLDSALKQAGLSVPK